MVEVLKLWGGVIGLNVDVDNFFYVVLLLSFRVYCGCVLLQVFWIFRRRLGGVVFFGNDVGRVVFFNGLVGEGVVIGGFIDFLEFFVVFVCAVYAIIFEYGVVNCQFFVLLFCKKLDRFGFILCGFSDGFLDVLFVKVDYFDLREVEVFELSVVIVDDEFYRFLFWWYGICSCCRYFCQRCFVG